MWNGTVEVATVLVQQCNILNTIITTHMQKKTR